jgi:hypothetical protein
MPLGSACAACEGKGEVSQRFACLSRVVDQTQTCVGLSAEAMEPTTAVGNEGGKDNVPEVVETVIGELLDILQDKVSCAGSLH